MFGVAQMFGVADLPGGLLPALIINLCIALVSFKAKLVDKSGLYSGTVVGVLVYLGMGHQGYIILFTFFLAGSLATKFKFQAKEKLGAAQGKGGRRGTRNVFANCGLATACALAAIFLDPSERPLIFIAFTAALATALGDTISTELGQIYGKRAFLLIGRKSVRPGTEGAISAEGTALGAGASGLIALLAYLFHPFPGFGLDAVLVVTSAAVTANLIESLAGGVYHKLNKKSPETWLNFANTLVGALLATAWFW